jgi:FAD binding domain
MYRNLPIAGLLLMPSIAITAPKKPDAIIIGAGIAGLSAALEAARSGAQVLVIDMSTVGGGHAILSNGAVCIVATSLQDKNQVVDSPELAQQDFLTRGEDANPEWVSAYVRNSKIWLYDWLSDAGVVFEALVKPPGNSVPRLHPVRGKGWGLVGALFRECLRHSNITFLWASKAEKLIMEAGSVTGFGGINGKAALEGTFLGPAIFMGRIAGKAIGKLPESKSVLLRELSPPSAKRPFDDQQCLRCHSVAQDIKKNHPGYWHYEQSHAKVLSRNYNCSKCHSELYPYQKAAHKMKRLALTYHCAVCHGVQLATSPAL